MHADLRSGGIEPHLNLEKHRRRPNFGGGAVFDVWMLFRTESGPGEERCQLVRADASSQHKVFPCPSCPQALSGKGLQNLESRVLHLVLNRDDLG